LPPLFAAPFLVALVLLEDALERRRVRAALDVGLVLGAALLDVPAHWVGGLSNGRPQIDRPMVTRLIRTVYPIDLSKPMRVYENEAG
jgi:hypothetical protein